MSTNKDVAKESLERVQHALENYTAQLNPGVGPFDAAEAEYLKVLGEAVLALGDVVVGDDPGRGNDEPFWRQGDPTTPG